jgi:hypothetical protein
MDPRLLEVLKKAKQVDKAAEKFDSGTTKKSNTSGLMEQMDGHQLISAEQMSSMGGNVMSNTAPAVSRADVNSPDYENKVKNSKLPPAVAKAMLKTPIPQPDAVSTNISEDDIREINPNYGKNVMEEYSDNDEHDFMTEQRHTPKSRVVEQPNRGGGISEAQVRKMIAEEISRALPKILESYFDKKIIKENMKIMKYVIKNSQK